MTTQTRKKEHNHVRIPKPDTGGAFKVKIFHRFHNLPPRVTDHLLARVEMMFGESPDERDFIMVRRGTVRDFESAARPPATAPPWTVGVPVIESASRSGKKCVVFKQMKDNRGKSVKHFKVRIDPLPVLEKRTRYRLEG